MNSTANISMTTKITKNSKSTPVSEFGRDPLSQNTFTLLTVVQPQSGSQIGLRKLTTMLQPSLALAVEAAVVMA